MEYETDVMTTAKISQQTRRRLHDWKRYFSFVNGSDVSIDEVIAAGLDALGQKHPSAESHPQLELA